ncbi:hypothetical protein UK23_06325 [Lentzea aerocolonigenes]|uniref:Cystathionine gamma-synthase n=1 Tax=Lentzea aerocolonigenes TaxID=68170 RepID=A0A0F0H9Q9_LENAE|nr:PLP-dependent transferase [Lentzea aerocolonigenes]KJK51586.1 hypothetical protein UK23_06325 [Lentzea aerocolonigenes]
MEFSAEARLIHTGTARAIGSPVGPALTLTSTYVSHGVHDPSLPAYGRNTNPGWQDVEHALAVIEGEGCQAVVFSSGQAAAMALMLTLSEGRERLVMLDDGYYKLRNLATKLRPHGVEVVTVDLLDLDAVETAIGAGPSVLWGETPTNPLLRVADLAGLSALADAAGTPFVVDNTVATALQQKPLEFGALASVYSLTKSLSGHSDVLGGAVVTRSAELAESLRAWRGTGGAILGPFESWLVLRGLKTLPLRLERQSQNALAVVEFLERHPRVTAVHYPDGPLVKTQMPNGAGCLLAFELSGTVADADAVVAAARLIVPSTSFGGVESTWERRARWAAETAPDTLIRIGTGVEPAADIIADLSQALRA